MFERFPFPSTITDSPWAPAQRFNRTFIQQQQEKLDSRPLTMEDEVNSRTQTEKQFSIDSILGKDEGDNTDYSSYFRNSSQQKSFYREMQDFGKNNQCRNYNNQMTKRIRYLI